MQADALLQIKCRSGAGAFDDTCHDSIERQQNNECQDGHKDVDGTFQVLAAVAHVAARDVHQGFAIDVRNLHLGLYHVEPVGRNHDGQSQAEESVDGSHRLLGVVACGHHDEFPDAFLLAYLLDFVKFVVRHCRALDGILAGDVDEALDVIAGGVAHGELVVVESHCSRAAADDQGGEGPLAGFDLVGCDVGDDGTDDIDEAEQYCPQDENHLIVAATHADHIVDKRQEEDEQRVDARAGSRGEQFLDA